MEKYIEELKAIIQSQSEIIAKMAIEIAELKEQLNQNSNNSSKPPSSDGLKKPRVKSLREKSGKKAGGQKGHKGHGLKIEREPDKTVKIEPINCNACEFDLSAAEKFRSDTRYVYDVEIEIKLIKYEIMGAECNDCGAVTIAEVPEECKSTINYGNTTRSLCVVLTNYANVSIDKTHKILRDLIGMPISGGTVKNIKTEFAGKSDGVIAEIKEKLFSSPVLNADETGGRVSGQTQWFHTVSNPKYTLISVHKKRGREGSESGGVLPEYTGTLVHDCWKPYFGFDKCEHALCCAHLLRELNALIEKDQKWASEMKELLLEMKRVVDSYRDDDKTELSRYYHNKFKTQYDTVLANAKNEIVPSGERKKSKAENLVIRIDQYRTEITRFTNDFNVPFDNNQAERDIRNIKVNQKVIGGYRTDDGAEDYAKTASVIGTVVKFGHSVFNSVKGLFDNFNPLSDATE
jgi:transposase